MFDFIDVSILNKTLQISISNDFLSWFFIILTPLMSLLVAFIAVFKEDIISLKKGPKIKIDYKPEEPYKRHRNFLETPACYYHFQVTNIKIKPCEKCIVELSEIYKKTSEGYVKIDDFVPITLKWYHTKDVNTSIYMHQKRYICLGFICKEGWGGHTRTFRAENTFCIEHSGDKIDDNTYWFYPEGNYQIYHTQLFFKNDSGIYRFRTSVYGSNIEPVQNWWELHWKGSKNKKWLERTDDLIITESSEPKKSEIRK